MFRRRFQVGHVAAHCDLKPRQETGFRRFLNAD
jgi:hypothetical protein